ncbi:MAG: sulfur carrier protein ThiS [Bacteroidetes bacterium]|nr:sulfur carrier protein ThiS [Bacteroidota bacterium]
MRQASADMELMVNGRELSSSSQNVAELLKEMQLNERPGIAVALNEQVVPRVEWQATPLRAQDRITIIAAVAGG